MKDSTILDTFLKVLNEAYAADPAALHALVCNRVPCNLTLADHPTIQVETNMVATGETYSVGILGIVNGLCEAITGQRVAVMYSDSDDNGQSKVLGFTQYKTNQVS